MEEFWEIHAREWFHGLAAIIQIAAAAIIAVAAAQATWKALLVFFHPATLERGTEDLRLRFGRWLVVALEFQVAADILHTAIAPSWSDIGQLAAIIVLRTVLSTALHIEIAKGTKTPTG